MVDRTGGQLYTIEGFAAALIMLITVYFVLGTTTTIYTPGDTHISDMQLEQLGTDALAMMDTPNTSTDTSNLAGFINNTGADSTLGPKNFSMMFLNYSDSTTIGTMDHIQFNATVYYRSGGQMKSYLFAKSPRDLTPGDHAVRVTRWVLIGNDAPSKSRTPIGADVLDHRNQTVLLEVLLWRG